MSPLIQILFTTFATTSVLLFQSHNLTAQSNKPRIIITADPELDDNNSLIRFLLYSNEFRIEGLIYASSQFHWKGDGKGTKFMVPGREYTRYGLNLCPCESYRWRNDERFIHETVEAYENVYPNLIIHNKDYPKPELLKSKIKYGNIEFEGDYSKDTEGSDLIRKLILDDIPGPLYITAWGGMSTISRALKSIEDQYKNSPNWNSLKEKISKKVILLPSGDQDGTYETYVRPHWPEIDYRQFRGGPNYGYGTQFVIAPENAPLLSADWMKKNISSKGPLGALYRVWGDGKQMVKDDVFDYFGFNGYSDEQLKAMGYIVWMPVQQPGSWLGEGDTPTFMNLLTNGLNAHLKNYPGGWAGRPFYPDAKTYVDPFNSDTTKQDLVIHQDMLKSINNPENDLPPFPDFFKAAHFDFTTRMTWSVTNKFEDANHNPRIKNWKEVEIKAKPGEVVKPRVNIDDPDGDVTELKWWEFKISKFSPTLKIEQVHSKNPIIKVPLDGKPGQEFYLVLEVRDLKEIPLTSYKVFRIIL